MRHRAADKFANDLIELHSCVTERRCRADSGCGPKEKCIGETDVPAGRCDTGDLNNGCREPGDCWSGICASGPRDGFRCQDGQPRSGCANDADCIESRCLAHGAGGLCTRGNVGEPCSESEGCAAGLFCVVAANGNQFFGTGLGACLTGASGDGCDDSSECQSHLCISNGCSSRDIMSACTKDDDCLSGICVFFPSTANGSCRAGNDYCNNDAHCLSGQCIYRIPGYGACAK
jgi:hypothetical protein